MPVVNQIMCSLITKGQGICCACGKRYKGNMWQPAAVISCSDCHRPFNMPLMEVKDFKVSATIHLFAQAQALLHSSHMYHEAKHAFANHGVKFSQLKLTFLP
ncbi:hypothetical protein HPP92_009834 [Vanilla planifolia]|uniref:Uncharacterized protein n=1 Tax=Vanilla planifolia TaxID=51239 RepID=A0A835RF09_VANPL|nr:hypothetical protein HPP92_009834 [Vanilla planifolia]